MLLARRRESQARRGDIELKQAVGDLLLRTLEGAWRGPGFACVRAKGAEAGAGRVGSSAARVEVPLPVCYTACRTWRERVLA